MSSTTGSEPDKLAGTTTAFNISLAIIVALLVIAIFYLNTLGLSVSVTMIIYWLVLPIFITLLSLITNVINQKLRCDFVNIITHLKVSWVTLLIAYIVLGITTISYVRAPVTSLFAGLFPASSSMSTVLGIESQMPVIRGVAVAYYMFFGVLLSQVITSGYGTICK